MEQVDFLAATWCCAAGSNRVTDINQSHAIESQSRGSTRLRELQQLLDDSVLRFSLPFPLLEINESKYTSFIPRSRVWWDRFQLIIVLYHVITLPLRWAWTTSDAFAYSPSSSTMPTLAWLIADYICDACVLLDIVIRSRQSLIQSRVGDHNVYLWRFVLDIVSILPSDVFALLPGLSVVDLPLLRANRLLRILTISQIFPIALPSWHIFRGPHLLSYAGPLFVLLCISTHILACGFIRLGWQQCNQNGWTFTSATSSTGASFSCWLVKDMSVSSQSFIYWYIRAVWFALANLLSVCWCPVAPVTDAERGIAIAAACVGACFTALCVGVFASYFHRDLSVEVEPDSFQHSDSSLVMFSATSDLPSHLNTERRLIAGLEIIKTVPFFREIPEILSNAIALQLQPMSFTRGRIICQPYVDHHIDNTDDCLFLLRSGSARLIFSPSNDVCAAEEVVVHAPCYFGQFGLIASDAIDYSSRRPLIALCESRQCELLSLTRGTLQQILRDIYPTSHIDVLNEIARRMGQLPVDEEKHVDSPVRKQRTLTTLAAVAGAHRVAQLRVSEIRESGHVGDATDDNSFQCACTCLRKHSASVADESSIPLKRRTSSWPVWSLVLSFASLYYAITLPLRLAFFSSKFDGILWQRSNSWSSSSALNYSPWIIWFAVDVAFDLVFWIDFGLRLCCLRDQHSHSCHNGLKLTVEFLCTLPVDFFIGWAFGWAYMPLLRVCRLVRVATRGRELWSDVTLRMTKHWSLRVTNSIGLVCLVMLISHCLACAWFIVSKWSDSNGTVSWVSDGVLSTPIVNQYFKSIYFVLMITISLGANSVTINSFAESLFVVLLMLLGSFCYYILLGALVANLHSALRSHFDRLFNSQRLKTLMQNSRWSASLRSRLTIAVNRILYRQPNAGDEFSREQELQRSIRMLASSALFLNCFDHQNSINDSLLRSLCIKLQRRSYEPGDTIFEVGDVCKFSLYLLSGHCEEFMTGSQSLLIHLNASASGSVLNEWQAVFREPRKHGVRAVSRCECFLLPIAEVEALCVERPAVLTQIRTNADILRQHDHQIAANVSLNFRASSKIRKLVQNRESPLIELHERVGDPSWNSLEGSAYFVPWAAPLVPAHPIRFIWNVLMAFLTLVLCIELPVRLCFLTEYHFSIASMHAWGWRCWLDAAIDVAAWCDIVLQSTVFVERDIHDGHLVLGIANQRHFYADVVTFLPLDWVLYLAGFDAGSVLLARLLRLGRAVHLREAVRYLMFGFEMFYVEWSFILLAAAHWTACLFFALGFNTGGLTWVGSDHILGSHVAYSPWRAGAPVSFSHSPALMSTGASLQSIASNTNASLVTGSSTLLDTYTRSALWAVGTALHVADVAPVSLYEIGFQLLISIFGVGVLALIVSALAQFFKNQDVEYDKVNLKLETVGSLAAQVLASDSWIDRARAGLDQTGISTVDTDGVATRFDELPIDPTMLPSSLRADLSAVSGIVPILRSLPLVASANLSSNAISELAAVAQVRLVDANEFVSRFGFPADEWIILLSGLVRSLSQPISQSDAIEHRHHRLVYSFLTDGSDLTGAAFLLNKSQQVCLQAVDPCRILVISRADVRRILSLFLSFEHVNALLAAANQEFALDNSVRRAVDQHLKRLSQSRSVRSRALNYTGDGVIFAHEQLIDDDKAARTIGFGGTDPVVSAWKQNMLTRYRVDVDAELAQWHSQSLSNHCVDLGSTSLNESTLFAPAVEFDEHPEFQLASHSGRDVSDHTTSSAAAVALLGSHGDAAIEEVAQLDRDIADRSMPGVVAEETPNSPSFSEAVAEFEDGKKLDVAERRKRLTVFVRFEGQHLSEDVNEIKYDVTSRGIDLIGTAVCATVVGGPHARRRLAALHNVTRQSHAVSSTLPVVEPAFVSTSVVFPFLEFLWIVYASIAFPFRAAFFSDIVANSSTLLFVWLCIDFGLDIIPIIACLRKYSMLNLFVALPFDLLALLVWLRGSSDFHTTLQALTLLRLTKLVRLFSFVQWSADDLKHLFAKGWSLDWIRIAFFLSSFGMVVHWIACAWYCVRTVDTVNSWLLSHNLSAATISRKYLASVYFATGTMSTVSFGDASPSNFAENLIRLLGILCGAIWFALASSACFSFMNRVAGVDAHKVRRLQVLRDQLRPHASFCRRALMQIQCSDTHSTTRQQLEVLSPTMRTEWLLMRYSSVIKQLPMFCGYSWGASHESSRDFCAVVALCAAVREDSYLEDDYLFVCGARDERIHFVLSGSVSVGEQIIESSKHNALVLGEQELPFTLAFSLRRQRVRCTSICDVVSISYSDLHRILDNHSVLRQHVFTWCQTLPESRVRANPSPSPSKRRDSKATRAASSAVHAVVQIDDQRVDESHLSTKQQLSVVWDRDARAAAAAELATALVESPVSADTSELEQWLRASKSTESETNSDQINEQTVMNAISRASENALSKMPVVQRSQTASAERVEPVQSTVSSARTNGQPVDMRALDIDALLQMAVADEDDKMMNGHFQSPSSAELLSSRAPPHVRLIRTDTPFGDTPRVDDSGKQHPSSLYSSQLSSRTEGLPPLSTRQQSALLVTARLQSSRQFSSRSSSQDASMPLEIELERLDDAMRAVPPAPSPSFFTTDDSVSPNTNSMSLYEIERRERAAAEAAAHAAELAPPATPAHQRMLVRAATIMSRIARRIADVDAVQHNVDPDSAEQVLANASAAVFGPSRSLRQISQTTGQIRLPPLQPDSPSSTDANAID